MFQREKTLPEKKKKSFNTLNFQHNPQDRCPKGVKTTALNEFLIHPHSFQINTHLNQKTFPLKENIKGKKPGF